jgi:hypothetical protein
MTGYADDWVIYTSDQDIDTAQTNIQTALNNISTWTRRKGFKISSEKTVAMLICRKKTHNHTDLVLRLKRQHLEIKDTHTILGLTFDSHLNWKTHIDEVRTKTLKRLNGEQTKECCKLYTRCWSYRLRSMAALPMGQLGTDSSRDSNQCTTKV